MEENISGAVIGTLTVTDPDAGDMHTMTVSDDRFEIMGDRLKLKSGQHLSRAAGTMVDATVTATDSGTPQRSLAHSFAIQVLANPFPWQNKAEPLNVDNMNGVMAHDALIVISELRANAGSFALPPARPATESRRFLDVFADNQVTARDALTVIAFLRGRAAAGAEGEPSSLSIASNSPMIHLADESRSDHNRLLSFSRAASPVLSVLTASALDHQNDLQRDLDCTNCGKRQRSPFTRLRSSGGQFVPTFFASKAKAQCYTHQLRLE
jgi:hypothetical protein